MCFLLKKVIGTLIFTPKTEFSSIIETIQNTSVYREFGQNVSVLVSNTVFLLNTAILNMGKMV